MDSIILDQYEFVTNVSTNTFEDFLAAFESIRLFYESRINIYLTELDSDKIEKLNSLSNVSIFKNTKILREHDIIYAGLKDDTNYIYFSPYVRILEPIDDVLAVMCQRFTVFRNISNKNIKEFLRKSLGTAYRDNHMAVDITLEMFSFNKKRDKRILDMWNEDGGSSVDVREKLLLTIYHLNLQYNIIQDPALMVKGRSFRAQSKSHQLLKLMNFGKRIVTYETKTNCAPKIKMGVLLTGLFEEVVIDIVNTLIKNSTCSVRLMNFSPEDDFRECFDLNQNEELIIIYGVDLYNISNILPDYFTKVAVLHSLHDFIEYSLHYRQIYGDNFALYSDDFKSDVRLLGLKESDFNKIHDLETEHILDNYINEYAHKISILNTYEIKTVMFNDVRDMSRLPGLLKLRDLISKDYQVSINTIMAEASKRLARDVLSNKEMDYQLSSFTGECSTIPQFSINSYKIS